MTGFLKRGFLPSVVTAVAVAGTGFAGENESVAADDRVARLEALLTAQQQKISTLEGQVAAASSQDVEKARTDAIKQQIREVLNEREFRDSLMGSTIQAGYNDGFYIGSSDEKFLMKFNGHMQVRWTFYETQTRNKYLLPDRDRDDKTGFSMDRIRFSINGHVYSKDLTYNLTLRADAADQQDVVAHYAYLNYRFRDEFQIQAGLFQLASTMDSLLDNSGYQGVDLGLYNAVFGLGNGVGVRFWGQVCDRKLTYYLDVVNSLNGDRNRPITPDPSELDGNPAILARAVWTILGEPGDYGVREGDTRKDKSTPVLGLGMSYAFNDDQGDRQTTRIPVPLVGWNPGRGGYGLTTTNGLQINQFSWDMGFKYCGFSAQGEYALRIVDPRRTDRRPFTPWFLISGDDSTTVQHGAYVQVGYFLPIPGLENKLEWMARVGGISALSDEQEGSWEYATGVNYYIEGHAVKLQADMVRVYEAPITSGYSSLANVNDKALVFRVQLNVAF